ncbi:MAG: hypothetical protein EBS38_04795 [Actinobacteria bacterium]|nr:hypothetical protein [Actinomycetota bacterium]
MQVRVSFSPSELAGVSVADQVFTEEEKAAMRERAREAREFKKLSGEEQVQRKIAEMDTHDQEMALRLHELILGISDKITTRTWYGMPAYYVNDKVICFYQSASKFKVRYSTFGFQEAANLDEGTFWPTSYALTKLTKDVEKQIVELVKKAIR